jgi:hypothetical protein
MQNRIETKGNYKLIWGSRGIIKTGRRHKTKALRLIQKSPKKFKDCSRLTSSKLAIAIH